MMFACTFVCAYILTWALSSNMQQVDALKRQRNHYLEELKEVTVMKRKEPELQNLQHQISSLENRLTFSKKDREVTVSYAVHSTLCMCMYTCRPSFRN